MWNFAISKLDVTLSSFVPMPECRRTSNIMPALLSQQEFMEKNALQSDSLIADEVKKIK